MKRTPLLLVSLFSAACAAGLPSEGVLLRVQTSGQGIREIQLERYLAGVLVKEIGDHWPLEALKAQAVASRTYALYRKEHPRDERFDLTDDVLDQVFEETSHPSQPIVRAVRETTGEVLKFEGQILSAFFHSCCGGISERGNLVWKDINASPLLQIRGDPFCAACPRNRWDFEISREEFESTLESNGFSLGRNGTVEVQARDESGRVLEIALPSGRKRQSLTGKRLREILGYDKIRSTLFEITDEEDRILFSGRGSGHGVGLCQWGAKGMADEGKTYREILEFYYPGAEMVSPEESSSQDPENLPLDEE